MGNLLGAPVVDKETHSGSTPEGLSYGVSSMQGWRIHMEDAHICQPYLFAEERAAGGGGGAEKGKEKADNKKEKAAAEGGAKSAAATASSEWKKIPVPGHSLYAVFDGHGGTFAAEYAGLNLCRVLSRQAKFVEYAKHVQEQQAANKQAETAVSGGESKTAAATGEEEERRRAAIRAGLDLLEGALKDAFVELDREIMREMRGLDPAEGANLPYGDDFDEHHSHGQIADPDAPEVEAMSVTVEANADPANPDPTPGSGSGGGGGGATGTNGGPARPPDYEDSGTTAIVVVLTPHSIVCANAGDSRAVYCKSGRAVPLSYDHKPDDEEEERRIKDAGGYVSGGRVEGDLAVSRGLGDFRFKDAETVMQGLGGAAEGGKAAATAAAKSDEGAGEADNNKSSNANCCSNNKAVSSEVASSSNSTSVLRPEDQKVSSVPDTIVQSRNPEQDEFIVVACDGIWDVQTNLECVKMISDIFSEGESEMGLACEEVLDLCLRRGSKDNMTALVVKLESQEIGEGGGVKARRELREAEAGDAGGGEHGSEGEKRKRDEFFSGSPAYS